MRCAVRGYVLYSNQMSTPSLPNFSQPTGFVGRATRETDEPAKPKLHPDEENIVAEMRQRYMDWEIADAEFMKNAERHLDFLGGDVWTDWDNNGTDVRKDLWTKGRTAIDIDLISPAVDLVVNQVRINKPTANFIPIAEGADQATADIRQGLYRNEDRECNAATARETAYQLSVSCGRGYARVMIEEEEGLNLDRRTALRRITDLHSVAYDTACMEFDCSDMEWGMFFEDVPLDLFRAQYGAEPDATGIGLPETMRAPWFKKGFVRMVDYYRKVWTMRKIAKLPEGATLDGKSYCYLENLPVGVSPVAIGSKRKCKVEWFKMTGAGILEIPEWQVPYIPLVVYIGREKIRGTKPKIHAGMVGPAIGVSRVHNFMESRLVDEVALSPLPHMQSAVGQFTPAQEQLVNTINSHPWANVQWTPVHDDSGTLLPAPQWVSPSPNVESVVVGAAHAKDNLNRILNTFAPQLGQIQGDQSGKAIKEVKNQGDIVHAAFSDNLDRALLYEARVRNALMDWLYTDERAITITQADDTQKQVLINKEFTDPDTGDTVHHLFGQGKYGVAVTTGPSYPTQAAEDNEKILRFSEVNPEVNMKAGDLVAKSLGLSMGMGDKIAERLAPPGADKNLPPGIQAIMQQGQQQIQFLTGLVQELKNEIQSKSMETASKERIAALNGRVQIALGILKAGSSGSELQLQAELQEIARLSSIDEAALDREAAQQQPVQGETE